VDAVETQARALRILQTVDELAQVAFQAASIVSARAPTRASADGEVSGSTTNSASRGPA
jgi:hypothetical protein